MPVLFVSVAAGATVSSAFTLERGDRRVSVAVASHAPNGWHIAFATTSGGPVWHRLSREDGSGQPFLITSGGFPAAATLRPASAWGRIETTSAMTATCSVTIAEVVQS